MSFLKSNIGYISMFIAVIGFGSGPPFVKLALQEFYVMDSWEKNYDKLHFI